MPVKAKFVVQFPDESYYRDRGRTPRHFMHNATKLSQRRAAQIAAELGGVVVPYQRAPQPLGK